MKSIVMPANVQLSEETKKQLSQEVKETWAAGNSLNHKKQFTATDMWNRNRRRRSASEMMRKWNLN